jgi:hypothetical protein
MTDRCAEELLKYDVYEMPPDLYKELILARWKTFIQEMKTSDNIAIMDCSFLQNPLTMLMAKYNETLKFHYRVCIGDGANQGYH